MHHRYRQTGLNVSRGKVNTFYHRSRWSGAYKTKKTCIYTCTYTCIAILPDGSNVVWHIAGYVELKSYGVAIHGCVDGFSLTIIWLNAYYTNNNTRVISGYYIKAISMLEGSPRWDSWQLAQAR